MAIGRGAKLGLGLAGALALAQLVPVDRTNPPVEEEIPAPPELHAVLRRVCYDCHSHETRWPWYSRVAPVSWLVARDVRHARKHMNFSTWNAYDAKERGENLDEAVEEVEEGNMPLPSYRFLHRDAELSETEVALLRAFAAAVGAGSGAGEAERDLEGGPRDSSSHDHGSHEH